MLNVIDSEPRVIALPTVPRRIPPELICKFPDVISSFCVGLAVPIPILPDPSTTKCVADDEPITNSGTPEPIAFGFTDNCAQGEEDARPSLTVKLFVFVNVLKSLRSVDEAAPDSDVRNPASLLNHDSLIDDEAVALTSPLDPVNRKPCPVPMFRLVVDAVVNDAYVVDE